MKKVLFIFILVFSLSFFFSCDRKTPEKEKEVKQYHISFASEDVEINKIDTMTITDLGSIVLPVAYSEGYQFSFWYYKLGDQNVTVTNKNVADFVKLKEDLLLYAKMIPTFNHTVWNIEFESTTKSGGEEIKKSSSTFVIDYFKLDDQNADISIESTINFSTVLSKRDYNLYQTIVKNGEEKKIRTTGDFVIPEIGSSLLDIVSDASSSSALNEALSKIITIGYDGGGISIKISSTNINECLDIISENLDNEESKEELVTFLRKAINSHTIPYIQKVDSTFDESILELGDEELIKKVKELIVSLKALVTDSNIDISFGSDISGEEKVTVIKFEYDEPDTGYHVSGTIKTNSTKGEIKDLLNINPNEYTLVDMDNFFDDLPL